MKDFLFLLVAGPFYLYSLLPLKIHYYLADLYMFFLAKLLGYRKSVITTNLARSFPNLKYKEIDLLAKKFYKYFASVIAENFWLVSTSENKITKMVTIDNPEVVKEIHDRGESVIFIAAHMGNWEFLALCDIYKYEGAIGYKRDQFVFAYKKQRSHIADRIIKWVRSNHSRNGTYKLGLVESKGIARFMIKNRREKYAYFLLADQCPKVGSKFSVDFLNQPTFMLNGPEVLSKILDCPVVFVEMYPKKRSEYVIKYHLITDKPSLNNEGDITRKYAAFLQESILRNPHNWLWSHKRWKRVPSDIEG